MLCTAPGAWRDVRPRHLVSRRVGGTNTTSCPRILARHDFYSSPEAQRAGCCFKPEQQALLSTQRYAPCDNATYGAEALLGALGARKLSLVGDSVTHQL